MERSFSRGHPGGHSDDTITATTDHNDHDEPDPDSSGSGSGSPKTGSSSVHNNEDMLEGIAEELREEEESDRTISGLDQDNDQTADDKEDDDGDGDGDEDDVPGEAEEEKNATLESLQPEIDHFLSSFSIPIKEAEKEKEKENPPLEGKGETSSPSSKEEEIVKGDQTEDKQEPLGGGGGGGGGELKEDEHGGGGDHHHQEQRPPKPRGKEEKVVSVDIPAYIEKFLDLFAEEVRKRDSNDGKGKWGQAAEEDTAFLEALDRVSKLAASLDGLRSDPILGGLVNLIGSIQQRAMSYLEEELRTLLEETLSDPDATCLDPKGKQHHHEEPEPEDGDQEGDQYDAFLGYTDDVVSHMAKIAGAMVSGGYESECCQVYTVIRRHAFGVSLTKTGFEKVSIDEVQKMHWDALEREIPAWNTAFRECATSFFGKEKRLADSVFERHPVIAGSLFCNLTRGVVIQLLNFAEAVAMTKKSAEKLFKFLDMYETLRDSVPSMDELFPEEAEAGGGGGELKTETFGARSRIGEAAICMFCDLENSIKADTAKTTVPGGAVHPLARYTMNYLKYACEYKTTLEQVFKEHSKIERADSTSRASFEGKGYTAGEDESQSPFAHQLIRVMDLLDSNLEGKSKLYRDVPLSCIFMMNNGRYILQKIKGSSEIHHAMGDTWCRKKSSDLRNYHNGYKRETWSKLLGCLAHEGLMVNNKVIKPVLKERFKAFNVLFDEIHRTQTSWVVHDDQLQSELRVSISAVIIPAYRSFLGRFSQCFTPGRQYEKYIKFQPEDIETAIDELFDGNAASNTARKRP